MIEDKNIHGSILDKIILKYTLSYRIVYMIVLRLEIVFK